MTEHELKDLVSRTLRCNNPAHELAIAAVLVEHGKTDSSRVIAEHAIGLLNTRDVVAAMRRRA